ncbi:hypothetical protein QTL86_11335 [Cellulosilyticum sp. ST5]|jgi:hypothetical protein
MTWGYILVLSAILIVSWKVGQPMVAKREQKKKALLKRQLK